MTMKADPSRIRLLIADDHYIVIMGLTALLKLRKEFQVVASARDGKAVQELYREHRPNVVLMDLQMPKLDGIGAVRELLAEFPDARVIILTSFGREEDVHLSFKVGARGYLLKEAELPVLAEAIHAVHRGERWMPANVAHMVAERAKLPELTQREVEVLGLVAKGLRNKEIADLLGFSEDGAKQHLRRIYGKLGVTARVEAIAEAQRRGILDRR
jgi:two-component system NarL family response regulator